jgi:hypothetical protein
MSWGTLFGSQYFRGRKVCWSSRMGTKTSDKQINYSYELAQTKQQVGALLVHRQATGKHEPTKLTMD